MERKKNAEKWMFLGNAWKKNIQSSTVTEGSHYVLRKKKSQG